jgi:hypothetical protein
MTACAWVNTSLATSKWYGHNQDLNASCSVRSNWTNPTIAPTTETAMTDNRARRMVQKVAAFRGQVTAMNRSIVMTVRMNGGMNFENSKTVK